MYLVQTDIEVPLSGPLCCHSRRAPKVQINIEDDCRPENINYYPSLAPIETEMEWIIICRNEDENNNINDNNTINIDDNDNTIDIKDDDDDSGFHSIDDGNDDDDVFYN
ncbi:hypothetical protein PV326_005147 [Microctonus aethiopoides]|nr:hypothetical protein PV326_005147 [Microctonus aethiopoides]